MRPALAGLALGVVACGGAQAGSSDGAGNSPEHEVFCMGSATKCDATARTFCRSRYGTDELRLVRRVPERGALVVICGN